MILYYSPGACSLADHIALHEAGMEFDRAKVDLKTHTVEGGKDYAAVNPKGYVPALELDDGELLTENIAILHWVADQTPALMAKGRHGRHRTLETLAFISTEIHKAFKPFFAGGSDEEKQRAGAAIARPLGLLADRIKADYLAA